EFSSSNTNVNKLMTNITWTQRGNLTGSPTDCPQRAERFGYLGDAQIFSQTACFGMDMAAFYTKFIRDIRDEQLGTGTNFGRFPFYAPTNGVYGWEDIGWQNAGLILPLRVYQNYGDTRILSEQYLSASNFMVFFV